MNGTISTVSPGFATTHTITSSSPSSLGTPMAAISATAGCRNSACSTSNDETFSPRRLIASFLRST
jgi:hypothetical protein